MIALAHHGTAKVLSEGIVMLVNRGSKSLSGSVEVGYLVSTVLVFVLL